MTRPLRELPLRELPREIAPGVWWVGGCLRSNAFEHPVHFHVSAYLIIGADKALLYDTAPPALWAQMDRDLDRLLDGRTLDYVVPSHPEIPHAGNLNKLLDKFPGAIAIGDMRDYHLYFPDHEHRMQSVPHGTTLDLGGGYKFTLLDAIIEDLPTTVWGYEHKQQVLFSVDALGYGHLPQSSPPPQGRPATHGTEVANVLSQSCVAIDEPLHAEGECALFASELDQPPRLELAAYLTQASLFWSRYVEIGPFFKRFEALLEQYPARFIAPAHGSVIDDLDIVMPAMRKAHQQAFIG